MILGKMGLKAPKLHQDLLAEGATDLARSCSRQLSPSPVGYLVPKMLSSLLSCTQKLQVLSGLRTT